MSGKSENVGQRGSGERRGNGRIRGQRIFGCSRSRELEYRRSRPWKEVRYSMQRGRMQIYGREKKEAPENRRRKMGVEKTRTRLKSYPAGSCID